MCVDEPFDLGITQEDRQRMAEWTARLQQHKARSDDGGSDGNVTDTHPLIQPVRTELAKMRYEEGACYTKSKKVAERVGASVTRVGKVMRYLEDQGEVSRFQERSGYSITWEITL